MDVVVDEIPDFVNQDFEYLVSDAQKAEKEADGGSQEPKKFTEAMAKERIEFFARGFTRVVGMATKTDATLSNAEYRDLASELAPGVVKLFNSQDAMPPWLLQLLGYLPYGGMLFALGMFGFSVNQKVRYEKDQQRAERRRQSEKQVNQPPESKTAEQGVEDGD